MELNSPVVILIGLAMISFIGFVISDSDSLTMELNSPVEILTGLAVISFIVGIVIYDSALTIRQVVDLAVQNPLVTVPVGLLFLFFLLFANPTRGSDDA
jgi:hypothetical protein